MNAAIEPREIIEQSRRDGLAILRGNAPDKLKLRGDAGALAKWKPIIAQRKADILPLIGAGDVERPQAQRFFCTTEQGINITEATEITLPALLARFRGYPSVDWQGLALIEASTSALWVVQRPDGILTTLRTVEPIGKPQSYRQAWPARFTTPDPVDEDDAEDFEERAGILEFDPGLAREAAEREARRLIEATRWCPGCRHLDALRRPDDARPHCAIGHALTWRQVGPGGVLTRPGRSDARDCGDRAPGSHV